MGEASSGERHPADAAARTGTGAGADRPARVPGADGAGAAPAGRRRGLDLSVPQVAGSAVAAVVAAKLASNLGVYGTIAGAGVVSALGTCGGSVLQYVFRHTGRRVQEAAVQAGPAARRALSRSDPSYRATFAPGTKDLDRKASAPHTTAGQDPNRTAAHPAGAGQNPDRAAAPYGTAGQDGDRTAAHPAGAGHGPNRTAAPYAAAGHDPSLTAASPAGAGRPSGVAGGYDGYGAATSYRAGRRRGGRRTVVAVALAFGLTMAGITGYEALAGENLSGHGGTTIGNALTGHGTGRSGGGSHPAGTDSPAPSAPTPSAPGRRHPGSGEPSSPHPATTAPGGGAQVTPSPAQTGPGTPPATPAPSPTATGGGDPTATAPQSPQPGDG
jgi:hypothetical protein